MKSNLKKAEMKVKNFFSNKEKIKVLEKTINLLENKKKEVLEKIKKLNLENNYYLSKIECGKVKSNSNSFKENYFENRLILQITKYEKIIDRIDVEIQLLKIKKEEIEIEQSYMKNLFSLFPEEHVKIMELKYGKNYNSLEVASKINSSLSYYDKNRKKILETIYNMSIFYTK